MVKTSKRQAVDTLPDIQTTISTAVVVELSADAARYEPIY